MPSLKFNTALGTWAVHVCISLLMLIYFLNYFTDLSNLILICSVLILIFLALLLVLRYKTLLLYTLAFALPLSVPYEIPGGAQISIAAEALCVLLSAYLLLKFLLGQISLKTCFDQPIAWFLAADLCWMFVSACCSEMPLVSFKRFLVRFCFYCAFYFFYRELFRQDLANIKKVFLVYSLGLLLPVFSTLYKHAQIGFVTVGSQSLSMPYYYDHTIYGAALACAFPFLIFGIFQARTAWQKAAFTALSLLFALALILSYSRAAWLSIILAFMIYFLVYYRIRFRYWLMAAALAGIFFSGSMNRIWENISSNKVQSHSNDISQHIRSISNVKTDASNLERINRWKCALRMFQDQPLLGFGPGTYQFFYGRYQHSNDLTRISTYNGNKGHAHSEYLNYLSESGLPGFLIFALMVSWVCFRGVHLIRHPAHAIVKKHSAYLFILLLSFFIHGFFNGFIEFDKIAFPVFASLAALGCLDQYNSSLTQTKA